MYFYERKGRGEEKTQKTWKRPMVVLPEGWELVESGKHAGKHYYRSSPETPGQWQPPPGVRIVFESLPVPSPRPGSEATGAMPRLSGRDPRCMGTAAMGSLGSPSPRSSR